MSADVSRNPGQDFPSSHIWLICSVNRTWDSCLTLPVQTDYVASCKNTLAEKIITKWLKGHDTWKEDSPRAVAFIMRWNGCWLTYKSFWKVLTSDCFIQGVLPVSTHDSCTIRTRGCPLGDSCGARHGAGEGSRPQLMAFVMVGRVGPAMGLSVNNHSLFLPASFQAWPQVKWCVRMALMSLMDTFNEMLWSNSQWNQKYLDQKGGWMQIKPITQMTALGCNK